MTTDRLKELTYLAEDEKELARVLRNIDMLQTMTTNCAGGFNITGTNFHSSELVRNLCKKFKPIVEEELERIHSEFEQG